MHKFIFIPALLLIFFSAANAQEKKYLYKDSTLSQSEELYDSSAVKLQAPVEDAEEKIIYKEQDNKKENEVDTTLYYNKLTVPADSVTVWKNLKAFAYVKNLDSLLKARKENVKKQEKQDTETYAPPPEASWLSRLLSSTGLQYILWTLAVLFVLFIVYNLFLAEGVFRKRTTASKSAAPEVEEEIINNKSDFEVLIKQAVQTGNYRLAVRYQYLQTLHKLADKKLIELAADKTNYQYVREITHQNYQNDFAALTLNYEYVWYGEFTIEENIYKTMNTGFSQFNNKL